MEKKYLKIPSKSYNIAGILLTVQFWNSRSQIININLFFLYFSTKISKRFPATQKQFCDGNSWIHFF